MITTRQMRVLAALAVLFWVAATAFLRVFPVATTDPVMGSIGFITSIPVCWLCVNAGRRWAGLARDQLIAGTAFVVAVAMLIDATALRWAHLVYGNASLPDFFRLGSAWLLWGYGVSLLIALAITGRRTAREARAIG